MAYRLIEAHLDALASQLKDNMASKVAELNVDYGDTLLVNITRWYLGGLPLEMPEIPCIAINPVSFELLEEWQGEGILGKSHFNIVIVVGDVDAERRFRMLTRYGRAVLELIQVWTTPYTKLYEGAWGWSEVMIAEPYLQGVAIPVQLIKAEDKI